MQLPDGKSGATFTGRGRRASATRRKASSGHGGTSADAAALVPRTALVDQLLASDEPVIAIVAPPGYGKSTLLAQWMHRLGPRVASVSCESAHNDPVALWSAVIAELDQIEPIRESASALLASGGGVDVIPRLVSIVGAMSQPVALALDNVEVVTSRECQASIAEFALRVPQGWRLALVSRDTPPIPMARLRVGRRVVEIGVDQLAMSRTEAAALLASARVHLSVAETDDLLEHTEGWPAGLYLAALATKAGARSTGLSFTGDDRLMGDYLRSELLARLSRTQATFLLKTSILEEVCGPLCDAVVDGRKSARLLEKLQSRNLLVMPLDSRGEWYRYHHLLREFLYAELRRDHADLLPELHSRAAAWFEANRMPEAAIDHAHAAGDNERVARLVLELMQPAWASGRIETVRRWMERLDDRHPVEHYAAIAAHAALIFGLLGRAGDSERWATVAERLPGTGTLPDGSTVEGTLAYMGANLCREGPRGMRRDSAAALAGLSPTSPYRATMVYTEGMSYLLEGDIERADAALAHAYDVATSVDASPLAALVLAEQFQIAAERDDWPSADALLKRAVEIIDTGRFDGYWTSALVFASAARAGAHRGEMPEARGYVKRAARLRPLLTYALPVVSVQALLEMARAYLALVDPAGARAVLGQAQGVLQQRPALGLLPDTAAQLQARVDQITSATAVGPSSLTMAELRLLPLLPTHLSFPEIGTRLYLSRHTVKTQARSVYRKLGVSSRAEAVERMAEVGLDV